MGCLLARCVFLIRLFVVALGFRFNRWICFWTGVFLRLAVLMMLTVVMWVLLLLCGCKAVLGCCAGLGVCCCVL